MALKQHFILADIQCYKWWYRGRIGNSPSRVVLRKGTLKICSTFTGKHPCRSAISIKLLCNFATLLKSYFGIDVPLQMCCIFAKHLFIRPLLEGCFCRIPYRLIMLRTHNSNNFHTTGIFLHSLKTLENVWLSMFSGDMERGHKHKLD